jgi:hypothetical protein
MVRWAPMWSARRVMAGGANNGARNPFALSEVEGSARA